MFEQLVKVRFKLDASDWHAHGSETLWAAPIPGAIGSFRIENSPFFTVGINYCDVVEAMLSDDKTIFDFDRVIKRGGHSTYMLIMTADDDKVRAYWNALEKQKCTYESMHVNLSMGRRPLWSVDVPPSANLIKIYRFLEKGELENIWIFQEGFSCLSR